MEAEEDKTLCLHEYLDLPLPSGSDKNDPYLMHQVFYCKKCLQIRRVAIRVDRIKFNPEFLADYDDHEPIVG